MRTDHTPRGGVVRPADVVDAFWLSAYARPATDATGTVYIAGHSSAAGRIVFDALLDSQGRPRDLAGMIITVRTAAGTLRYVIQGRARIYAKNRITHAKQVWRQVPGRLLLITCDQSDPSKNAVFFAQVVTVSKPGIAPT